jgi:hypothetical protein
MEIRKMVTRSKASDAAMVLKVATKQMSASVRFPGN